MSTKLITLICGTEFYNEESKSILESSLTSGIPLEYSCNTGLCGVCKARVTKGKSIIIKPEICLNQNELDEGFILTCCRSAQTNIFLEAENLSKYDIPKIKNFPAKVDSVNFLNDTVIEVLLRLPPNLNFEFLPGQYIDIIKNGLRRSYSIAGTQDNNKIKLHIKFIEGGLLSNYWFVELKVNDLLHIEGPKGSFFIRDNNKKNILLFATGTGIAPIKSMLESNLLTKFYNKNIYLFWGGRTKDDIYWTPDFNNENFYYFPTISREKHPGYHSQYVQELVPDEVNINEIDVYACGSIEMINSTKNKFLKLGVSHKHFHYDAFLASG